MIILASKTCLKSATEIPNDHLLYVHPQTMFAMLVHMQCAPVRALLAQW